MKPLLLILSFFLFVQLLHAQDAAKMTEEGNNYYRQQQYDKAEESYRKALGLSPQNTEIKFNLANTLIKQNKTDEATQLLADLESGRANNSLKSKSAYNRGVVHSQQKKLEESIEAYKQALRLNSSDQEARENLQKALLELKKKNPPKKDESKKKKDQPQKQQQPKPKLNEKEVQQHLKLLEQKEKELQKKLQKNSTKTGANEQKDW